MLILSLAIYAFAMTSANLLVGIFGPAITPINAFVLIGLDLSLRDWLHVRLKTWKMLSLIAGSGLLTYLLNPAAGQIAIASACAFSAAALVDWAVFLKVPGTWMKKANASNFAGAAVDSFIFPLIAFGSIMPSIVAMQFVAKVCGGMIWSWVLNRPKLREI